MSSTPTGAGDFATCSRMASERAMAPSLSRLPRARVRRARGPAASPAALADVLLRRTLVAISAGILRPLGRGRQLALRRPLPREGQLKHERGQRHRRPGRPYSHLARLSVSKVSRIVQRPQCRGETPFSARKISARVPRIDWPIAARLRSAIERQRADQNVVLDLL